MHKIQNLKHNNLNKKTSVTNGLYVPTPIDQSFTMIMLKRNIHVLHCSIYNKSYSCLTKLVQHRHYSNVISQDKHGKLAMKQEHAQNVLWAEVVT